MRKTILILVIALAFAANSYAQKDVSKNEDRLRYGVWGHYGLNWHSGSFAQLPGVASCCPEFTDGDGGGINLGLLFEIPVARNFLIGIRAGYYDRSGEFSADETETVYDYSIDSDAQGLFRHTLDVSVGAIAIEPMAQYRVFDQLFLHAGFQLGFINLAKSYDHIEELIEPETVYYENGLRERLNASGDLEELNGISFSPLVGASYEFALDRKKEFLLAPEIFYTIGLTDIVSDVDWKVNTLRLGLAFKYSPAGATTPPKDELSGSVDASGVFPDGTESPIVTVQVEEFLSTNLKPLLTYVFFDENSSILPPRYNKLTPSQTNSFSEDQLYSLDAMETYYHVLNIIGKRMRQNPDAKIAIDGCNSNEGKEKNNLRLSQKRAETVRNYLVNVWKIAPERLIVDKRNLPQEPSNIKDPDGIVENRRVEITSNKWEIIAPVTAKDTFRTVTPPKVRFKTDFSSDAGIRKWEINASQSGKNLNTLAGTGTLPPVVDWQLGLNQKKIPRTEKMLDYSMSLVDNEGNVFETGMKSVPVEQITIQQKRRNRIKDKYIDRISLILFSYDEASLSFYNDKVVKIVQNMAKPNSEITVTGHTDRMGRDEYNRKLSKDRAQVVADNLKAKVVSTKGEGENQLIYNNNLPEGRFYCRRVDIMVETPIK